MEIRPLDKILTDETLTDQERFEEFVMSRAPGWGMSKAEFEEINYLEHWAYDIEETGGDDIQAPAKLAREVGLSHGTYAAVAYRFLDPTAEW